MQGLALSREAPLFGRAQELFELLPLELPYVADAIGSRSARHTLEFYAAWGGVPRYWELAERFGDVVEGVESLVLDPRGPLHREPDRLLLEEMPPATEVRPVLDAIGAGAHRVSEIGARIGRPATSLSRPLERLLELGLVARELPFGEPPRGSRRSLYRIADPFMRLWFSVVAPRRGELVSGTPASRRAVLKRYWGTLLAQAWEELCRHRLPLAAADSGVGRLGPWKPASRWWRGEAPEWDVVAEHVEGDRLLVGEAKFAAGPVPSQQLEHLTAGVAARALPEMPSRYRRHKIVRALFVPEARRRDAAAIGDVEVLALADLL
jgi:AAA+ ATPase superfamily predicted ATPase